jgi:hypothetical protein
VAERINLRLIPAAVATRSAFADACGLARSLARIEQLAE